MGKMIASKVCALQGHDLKSLQVTSNLIDPKTQQVLPKFEIRCAKCSLPLAECEKDQRPWEQRERKKKLLKEGNHEQHNDTARSDHGTATATAEAGAREEANQDS